MPFRVLFVCTGNVCRSPMAALLFGSLTDPSADVVAESAGTHALVGRPVDTSTAIVLGQLGVDPSHHRARQLVPEAARAADLILTAAVEHRDLVITEVPAAFRRTFTMKEFARLAQGMPPTDDPETSVALADGRRSRVRPVRHGADDMPDPYLGSVAQARAVADQVIAAVRVAVGALGVSGPRTAGTRT